MLVEYRRTFVHGLCEILYSVGELLDVEEDARLLLDGGGVVVRGEVVGDFCSSAVNLAHPLVVPLSFP